MSELIMLLFHVLSTNRVSKNRWIRLKRKRRRRRRIIDFNILILVDNFETPERKERGREREEERGQVL